MFGGEYPEGNVFKEKQAEIFKIKDVAENFETFFAQSRLDCDCNKKIICKLSKMKRIKGRYKVC